jgi:hypothetical protein
MTYRRTMLALVAASAAMASPPSAAQSHDEHATETPAAPKATPMSCPMMAEGNEAQHQRDGQQRMSEMRQMMEQVHAEMQAMRQEMMRMREEMQQRR